MALIEFKDLPDTSTPINADNLNNNFEECYNIVESGTNANGTYVKFNDGTMIQYGRCANTHSIDTSYGSVYIGDLQIITLPSAFVDTNYKIMLTAIAPMNSAYVVDDNKTTTQVYYFPVSYLSRTSRELSINFVAIGKWK